MGNIKKFEDYKIANHRDLMTSTTWSPEYYINKDKNKNPFILKKGKLVKIEDKKTIPTKAFYLTDKEVKEYNEISEEIEKLQEEQEKILKIKN